MRKLWVLFSIFFMASVALGIGASSRSQWFDLWKSSDKTKTWTPPSVTGTLSCIACTETLTNKSMSGSSNTFTNIPNSATTATSANTASAIVARDASGNFSANTLTLGTNLSVPNGGTGASSFTSNGLLLGQGTSGLATLDPPAAAGRVLVYNGSSPAYSATPTLGVAGATLGTLTLAGNTSGSAKIQPAAAAGTGVLQLNASGTMTVPDGTDTLVGKATTDTLTNKSIDASQLTGSVAAGRMPALTGDVTTSAGAVATTAAATQANISSLSKSTGVSVHGTNTNDSASAGFVGEYISGRPGADVTPAASGSAKTVTSISLTAGDWDVQGLVFMSISASGILNHTASISDTDNVHSFNSFTGYVTFPDSATTTASANQAVNTGTARISLSTTTTIYLVATVNYSSLSTTKYLTNSFIYARRVR